MLSTKNSAGYYDVTRYKRFIFTPKALLNTDKFLAILANDELHKSEVSGIVEEKGRFALTSCEKWIK